MRAHWHETTDEGAIDAATLAEHGVIYEFLGSDPAEYQPRLDAYKTERGYGTQDQIGLSPDTPNLEAICAKFVDEHLHEDDEVRFVLEGEGIFDVRSNDDRWMRIVVEPGDLIIVLSYAQYDEAELDGYEPIVVHVDDKNRETSQLVSDTIPEVWDAS